MIYPEITNHELILEEASRLRSLPLDIAKEKIDRALIETAKILGNPATTKGRDLRQLIERSTQLSAPMIEWALQTSFEKVNSDALDRLRISILQNIYDRFRITQYSPKQLIVLVLSGNVTTAAIRAIAIPLALGATVLVKTSSRDAAVAQAFAHTLSMVDPDVGQRISVLTYQGGNDIFDTTMANIGDAIAVYGSDQTIDRWKNLVPSHVQLISHGHGFGAGWVDCPIDLSTNLSKLTDAFALDIAAYDQHGCLSPHAIWVRGSLANAIQFAQQLSESLKNIETTLPRGKLSPQQVIATKTYITVQQIRGNIFEGTSHTVAINETFYPSPGSRMIQVIPCESLNSFILQMNQFGIFLKTVGIIEQPQLMDQLSQTLLAKPTIVHTGSMQTPELDSNTDGHPCWFGYLQIPLR